MEARGEIFTVPVENGDVRNITQSSGVADRQPIWSPDGKQIAWFSDAGGKGYSLHIADQEGTGVHKQISIGESKLGWEPAWSPDSKYIAFVDDDVRIKVLEIATGKIQTADVAGMNLERGGMGITWSPDSKWLAYSKTGPNSLHRIMVWSLDTKKVQALSDPMADAQGPVWDRGGKFLYFLASTNIALGSGWANTSSMQAKPSFAAYVIVLRKGEASPFVLKSDEYH
jgi:tricorn protease